MPLGEDSFQPMYAMAVNPDTQQPLYTMAINQEYRPEPKMQAPNTGTDQSQRGTGRHKVHFHGPLMENHEPGAARMVPLYPTDEDLEHANSQLPPISGSGSPLSIDALGRRIQALTPISERDSAEDPRSQHKENNPRLNQVQDWLHSAGSALADKFTAEKAVVIPGPSNPPSMIPQTGKGSPGPTSSSKPKKKSPFGKSLKRSDKKKQLPVSEPQQEAAAEAPEIVVTPSPGPTENIEPMPWTPDLFDAPDAHMRATAAPPAIHDLATDILVPTPLMADFEHSLQDDAHVLSPKSTAPEEHALSKDKKVDFPQLSDAEHNLSSDDKVEFPNPADHEHKISKDEQVTSSDEPVHEHNLSLDEVVDIPNDDMVWLEQPPEAHRLSEDVKVDAPSPLTGEHDLQSDLRFPTPELLQALDHRLSKDKYVSAPELLQAYEHRLSKDTRVQSPAPKGPFIHGIQLDERVPAPELVWTTLQHDILQDRQVLSPSPLFEEHDLHADERVKTPALLPPKEHDIQSDKRVADPPGPSKGHGLQEDETVPSSSRKRAKDHSLSHDNKVAQRAYQLLEHFLEQDRKASGRSEKSR